jgi:hypothetical protein
MHSFPGHVRGTAVVGKGGRLERINEGEYDRCTLRICMKIEN